MTQAAASSRRGSLVPALLDFERMPGRYPLVMREPRELFDEAQAVLQLAAGRAVEGLTELAGNEEVDARRAARFFVRTAFLRAGNDHYALLGLPHAADADQIRDHYRLMIRMTHPDFQASGEHWPPDAASRINIANDVLSSPERRADYDATLQAAAAPATTSAGSSPKPAATSLAPRKKPPLRAKGLPRAPLSQRWGSVSTKAKWILASIGALLSGGALLMLNTSDNGSLTARQRTINEDTASYIEAGARLPHPPEVKPPAKPEAAPEHAANAAPEMQHVTVSQRTLAAPAAAPAPLPAPAPASQLALTMERRLASVPAPAASEPVAPVVAATPAAPAATAAASQAPGPEVAEAQRLTMTQVHPALTNVVGSLYSGRGENLAQWIGSDWRSMPANSAFVTQFNQWVGGQKVTQLGKVSFKSKTLGDQLVVDGVVEVHLQDSNNTVQVRDLQLRAYFQPQDGRPVLTQLAASQAR